MKKTSKKNTKKVAKKLEWPWSIINDVKVENRFWSRKEMPNNTPFFAHGHVSGNGDEVVSGSVYYTLPDCDTKEKAEKLVDALLYEVDQDLAYLGGILDFLVLKKNSKFKAKK